MEYNMKMAAHYLVAAERSFLPSTRVNEIELSYCLSQRCLYTRKFTKKGHMLIFNYDSASLQWKSDLGDTEILLLQHQEHYQVVRWIEICAIEAGIVKPYFFGLSLLAISQGVTSQFTIRDGHNGRWIPNSTVWHQFEIAKAIAEVNAEW